MFSMKCDWNLAKTQFGIVKNIFNVMRLESGYDTIWNCRRKFSMRCDWNFAKTQFGTVLEQFQ